MGFGNHGNRQIIAWAILIEKSKANQHERTRFTNPDPTPPTPQPSTPSPHPLLFYVWKNYVSI